MGKKAWVAWMLLGTLVSAFYPLLKPGGIVAIVVNHTVGLSTIAVIVLSTRRNRPRKARAWYIFAGGVALSVAGDITYEVSGLILGTHPYPSWDDALYFASYPLLFAGMLLAVRGRGKRDLPSALDVAVIAVGVALVYWVFVITPAFTDHSRPLFERLVTVSYPTCDVLMCAVAARLLTRAGSRSVSLLLLVAGAALALGGDVAWTVTSSFSSYSGGVVDAVFLFGYVCWGGAALHPSMRAAGMTQLTGADRFGAGRVLVLAASTLLLPVVLIVQGSRHQPIAWPAAAVGAVALFLLLLARMAGFAGQVHHQAAKLSDLATQDELTGLTNRRRFEQQVAEAVASGSPQVLSLDLNGFKTINDRLGHAVGDHLLVALAARLRLLLREQDVVARMGADEFALLVPDATAAEGDAIVARVSAALGDPFDAGGNELLIGAAIGIADGSGTRDATELLRRADVAMHAAKSGGARHRRYGVELDDQAGEEARLGAQLRIGLDKGQFRLVYQPIVDLPDGRLRYVESLVRWAHPTRGLVSPVDFIPVAEQNGLIVELGEWILRTACAQFVTWQTGGLGPERISVNVSARQLAEPGFADLVAEILRDAGMEPGDLIVEVTETAVFGGGAAVQAVMEIHRLGVRIALDDFGTGHSSLGLLQTIPVDVLKVDKSFVDNLTMAGRHAVIATALIQVSNGLGLAAVAEGVETAEQAAELYRLGYQLAQGYYFGKPVAEPDFAAAAV